MEVDENALAELFYTSGTSDAPRGVMLTHRNIYLHALLVIASGRTSRDVAGDTSCDSVVLHTIPLFHANGWGSAHTITLVGGTHVMVHQFVPGGRLSPHRAGESHELFAGADDGHGAGELSRP